MDNQEPELTPISNLELLHSGHKLPEQSLIPDVPAINQTTVNDIIHQWQPMGIRVSMNLPFVGNDKDFLFAIRNGPFIPQFDYTYKDYVNKNKTSTISNINEYAYTNMMPVTYAYAEGKQIDPDQAPIFITHYDQPPPLSSLSTMFRKWRGTMHYRIRVVAGFTTQGYIISTLYRNVRRPPLIVNRANYAASVLGQDASYRQGMVNSYVMGDTAMFRHFEVQVPFEYPMPYYDQFNWIANRTRPSMFFLTNDNGTDPPTTSTISTIYNEPYGDNFLLFGLRGELQSSVQGSKISFELEYRAGDDFQFSDPFLPIDILYLKSTYDSDLTYSQSPSTSWESTGYTHRKRASQVKQQQQSERVIPADQMTDKLLAIKNQEEVRRRSEQQRQQQLQQRQTRRGKRDVSDDEEDEHQEKEPDIREDVKPLRKSLREVLNF